MRKEFKNSVLNGFTRIQFLTLFDSIPNFIYFLKLIMELREKFHSIIKILICGKRISRRGANIIENSACR